MLGPLLDGVRRTGELLPGREPPLRLDRHGFLERRLLRRLLRPDPGRRRHGQRHLLLRQRDHRSGARRASAARPGRAGLPARRRAQHRAELGRVAARVLDGHRADVPFSLLWLGDDRAASRTLAGWAGVDPGQVVGGPPAPPVARGRRSRPDRSPVGDLLGGLPPDAADQALVLPITATNEPAGVLVVGRRPPAAAHRRVPRLRSTWSPRRSPARSASSGRTSRNGRGPPSWPRWTAPRPTSSPTSATSSAPR